MLNVVTTGESLAVFSPEPVAHIAEGGHFRLGTAGAESNVAIGLAGLGVSTGWHGRLGSDPFGAMILDRLMSAGVNTASVEIDAARPTGLYVKDSAAGTVHYRRSGSAGAAMDATTAARLPHANITHATGVTAALSPSCRSYLDSIVDHTAGTISFDVNHRPALWPASEAAPVLLRIARRCDIVFVGRDEAETLWGTATPAMIRELLPEPKLLVVKDGAIGATAFTGPDDNLFEPTPPVLVVEPVGAGDAFAAGYLAGIVHGLNPRACLRLGHAMAARALATIDDIPAAPTPDESARLVSAARTAS